jgi:hypothetical protein
MTRSIPHYPDLDHYKKEAKARLKACRSGDHAAIARVRAAVPGPAGAEAELSLSEVQLAIAREHGLASWPRFKRHVTEQTAVGDLAEAPAARSRSTFSQEPSQKPNQEPSRDAAPHPARATRAALHCSFCGKSEDVVAKLIAGSRAYICDVCLGLTVEILEAEETPVQETLRATLGDAVTRLGRRAKARLRPLRCSFCRKSQTRVKKLVAGPAVYICDECAGIASDILQSEETPRPSPT